MINTYAMRRHLQLLAGARRHDLREVSLKLREEARAHVQMLSTTIRPTNEALEKRRAKDEIRTSAHRSSTALNVGRS